MADHGSERSTQLHLDVVSVVSVVLADPTEGGREPGQIAGEHPVEDVPLALQHHRLEVFRLGNVALPGRCPGRLCVAAQEQPAGQGRELVAGGAVHGPAVGELLVRLQDLLDHDPGLGRRLPEPAGVGLGVEQTVRVVDAQALDLALFNPLQRERMGRVEDLGALYPKSGQRVDVEETPVVEVLTGGTPVREAVVLPLQEGVELVVVLVHFGQDLVHRRRHLGPLVQQAGELPTDHGLVPVPAFDALGVDGRGQGQRGQNLGRKEQVVGAAAPGRFLEQRGHRGRGGRHLVVVVGVDGEAGPASHHAKVTVFEDPTVVIAEDGKQGLILKALIARMPVDVEEAGEAGRGPVLEHIPPPAVVLAGDGHVVGDDVDHLAEAVALQGGHEAGVGVGTAQLRVDLGVVHHVIAVGAARGGLQVGRQVDVAHAQGGQIGHHRRRFVESEARPQLQPVGRARGVTHPKRRA